MHDTLPQRQTLPTGPVMVAMDNDVQAQPPHGRRAALRQRQVTVTIFGAHTVAQRPVVQSEQVIRNQRMESSIDLFNAVFVQHSDDAVIDSGVHEENRST